ncbi:MAG: DHH family phosphoesterase [Eubacteriales bacterium]
MPAIYRFLPFADQLIPPEQAHPAEAVVCVDCADLGRAGRCEPLFRAAKATLNIDHHGTNDRYAEHNYVQKAGATGELIFNVIASLKITLNKNIASCLYAAITTDTGNFSYSNTTPQTMRIAAGYSRHRNRSSVPQPLPVSHGAVPQTQAPCAWRKQSEAL